jgi:hypothetical protein
MHQDERVLLRRVTSGVLGGEGRIKLPLLELFDNGGDEKELEEEEVEKGAKMLEMGREWRRS